MNPFSLPYRVLESAAEDIRNERDLIIMIWLVSVLAVAAVVTATVLLIRHHRLRAATATEETPPTYDIPTLREYYELTPREGDVLERMLAGDDDIGIAERLGISLSTVHGHIRHIYEKTDARSFRELLGACRMCEKPTDPFA